MRRRGACQRSSSPRLDLELTVRPTSRRTPRYARMTLVFIVSARYQVLLMDEFGCSQRFEARDADKQHSHADHEIDGQCLAIST